MAVSKKRVRAAHIAAAERLGEAMVGKVEPFLKGMGRERAVRLFDVWEGALKPLQGVPDPPDWADVLVKTCADAFQFEFPEIAAAVETLLSQNEENP